MIAVRVKPRFRCAYCPRVSTKAAMEAHEKRCFYNPDRYCILCENTGWFPDGDCGNYGWHQCPYCLKMRETLQGRLCRMEDEDADETEVALIDGLIGALDEKLRAYPTIHAGQAKHGGWGDRISWSPFFTAYRATYSKPPKVDPDSDPFADEPTCGAPQEVQEQDG